MANHLLGHFTSQIKNKKIRARIVFFTLGIGSLVWFLVRVIPKPTRAAYPCMRAAAPVMSGFVLYLLSLAGSVVAFRKAKERFRSSRYWVAAVFGLTAAISAFVFFGNNVYEAVASTNMYVSTDHTPNSPIGEAKGVYPGRVSWVMDKNSTNENCTNKSGDYWFMDKNTNQVTVRKMLADGLMSLSGQNTSLSAWDAIFRNFNYTRTKEWKGYKQGEKIVVKINTTSLGNGGRHLNEGMNSTPQLVLALLEQLVDTLKIAQADITLGDPYRGFSNDYWDLCHSKYPNVHYCEGLGTDGREQTEISTQEVFFTSDGEFQSRLPKSYMEADYLINMPCLKSHGSAGITIAAKNHQGSVIGPDQDASSQGMGPYLHYSYPDNTENQIMGMYRHIVDYMAHERLGGNTLVYIVDALWSGRDWFGAVEKWKMAPFSSDWTSSLFLSQDPVAIESVGFDFLYNEYKDFSSSHNNVVFPLWEGVQDYIHQAADPSNWPEDIKYDPNSVDHNAPVGSLGIHEHWNNVASKQYQQNLGESYGIELVGIPASLASTNKINITGISLPSTLTITGETSIQVSVSPENATNKAIIWESSDPTIAIVNENGLLTPLKSGSITLYAVSKDGNKRASSQVTVDFNSGISIMSISEYTIYPNPAISDARIAYNLKEKAEVYAEVLSLDGKILLCTPLIKQNAGKNTLTVSFIENGIRNGIYICRLTARGKSTSTFSSRIVVDGNQN